MVWPEVLPARRHSLQSRSNQHGPRGGGSPALPGSQNCRVCRGAAAVIEDPRVAAEGIAQRTDERKAAGVDPAPEEARARHSRARLVPRTSSPAAGRHFGRRHCPIRRTIQRTRGAWLYEGSYGKAREPRVPLVGFDDSVPVDEEMANTGTSTGREAGAGKSWRIHLAVLAVASAIYVGCIVSPPSLMDDVYAGQAQIAPDMLTSGGWVP